MSEQPQDKTEPWGAGKQAIVVDDDPTSIELIKNLLLKQGFEVLTADNGQKAWLMLTPDIHPSIIITDILMPEMDGLKFLKELKNNDETNSIPVLVISTRVNMKESLLVMGADVFIEKPIAAESFLIEVQKLANQAPKKEPPKEKPPSEEKS